MALIGQFAEELIVQGTGTEPGVRIDSTSEQSPPIERIALTTEDAATVHSLAEQVAAEISDDLTAADLRHVALMAHELPRSIRQVLVDFRLSGTPNGGFVVSGLTVSDDALGPTPKVAQGAAPTLEASRANVALLLLASILGDPFSYAAVQDGSLILDICPIPGDEETQLASSSLGGLAWHNEDAFHDFRADWLLLMCMRNSQGVPTTFARIDDAAMSDEVRNALFEPLYVIAPDSSHLSSSETPAPQTISVLSGQRNAPFVRVDPEFMERELWDKEVEKALLTLIDELDAHLQDVILRPGDVLVVDNLRAVHGRRPFEARYDGSDRWLRVVNVTADLRKSAALHSRSDKRPSRHGRALGTQGVARPGARGGVPSR
jgi:Fe(II)/alpha-ketoglutarate-dependent arginine beta-hydroxylase